MNKPATNTTTQEQPCQQSYHLQDNDDNDDLEEDPYFLEVEEFMLNDSNGYEEGDNSPGKKITTSITNAPEKMKPLWLI